MISRSVSLQAKSLRRAWEDAYLTYRRNGWWRLWRTRRISQFGINPGDKVLDLGCGDGPNMVILRAMGVRTMVGVDISKRMLAYAKKNNPHAIFVRASADRLPFKSASFDVVLVDSVFHHMFRLRRAIKEIHRVLVPGGYLDFIEPHRSLLRSLIDFLSFLPVPRWVPILGKRHEFFASGELPVMRHWLNSQKAFDALLKSSGMVKVIDKIDVLSRIGKYRKV